MKKSLRRIVAVGLAAALSAASTAHAVRIGDLLSAPIPDAPVAAADAPVIAWVGKERGVRNVWVARAPAFVPRRLTAYEHDDGQQIGALQLSSDGRHLVYVRGGTPDASGQANNPVSDPDGAEQAVWHVSTEGGGKPQRIEAGRAAVFAPTGNALIVQSRTGFGCHPVPAAGDAPGWCLPAMLKLKGSNVARSFSPEGDRLLFTSERGDHAFVGVLTLSDRTVQWLAPDFAVDRYPVWSPDGRRVAFLRFDTRRAGEAFRVDGAEPFEVWVADAPSGQGRRLHRSNEHAGGYAQLVQSDALRWTRDDRLLFPSEADGWMRWYALPVDEPGHVAPVAVSPPHCEAEGLTLAADGQAIFSSNCGDREHRQLYAASTRTAPRVLSANDAIATEPVLIAGDRWIAFRHADAKLPTAIAVVPREGGQVRRIYPAKLPDGFPLDAMIVPKTITLRAADGFETKAQLFEPRTASNRPRPALVYAHGGPIRQMLPGWNPMDYYYYDYANQQWLADQGFVVLAVNFRAGSGYGQAFRRAPAQGPRGASEYQDLLAARAWLAARPDVDSSRIGIFGGSYGGYLTSLALARDSKLFAAGVDRHGVHDWRESAKGGDNSGLWGLQADELELAGSSSPITRIADWRSPVLVIHGDDDPAVLFAQSTNLVTALRRQQVPVETLVLPGEHHFFLRHASWLQVHERTLDFFTRHLQTP